MKERDRYLKIVKWSEKDQSGDSLNNFCIKSAKKSLSTQTKFPDDKKPRLNDNSV